MWASPPTPITRWVPCRGGGPHPPIKAFGGYELKVKLGYEVTGTLKVVVAEA